MAASRSQQAKVDEGNEKGSRELQNRNNQVQTTLKTFINNQDYITRTMTKEYMRFGSVQ